MSWLSSPLVFSPAPLFFVGLCDQPVLSNLKTAICHEYFISWRQLIAESSRFYFLNFQSVCLFFLSLERHPSLSHYQLGDSQNSPQIARRIPPGTNMPPHCPAVLRESSSHPQSGSHVIRPAPLHPHIFAHFHLHFTWQQP